MRINFYSDWPLASTYLEPLYKYIQDREPTWELDFGSVSSRSFKKNKYDVVINCDENSASPRGKLYTLCIFHGLASKGQAFSTARRSSFVDKDTIFAVPGRYYENLLKDIGVPDKRILVSGLTKHDGLQKRVLYAPTHNPSLSAIPIVEDRIYEIPNVTVHLHQWTRTGTRPHHVRFRGYYPNHENREDIYDLLQESDVIIGDFGSIVLEGIALGKQAIQVVNPEWRSWYENEKKLNKDEIDKLPEVYLAGKYAVQAHSFEDILDVINMEESVGHASKNIYQWIKNNCSG